MKDSLDKILKMLTDLNPATEPRVSAINLRLINGQQMTVNDVRLARPLIYARSAHDPIKWEVLPLDEILGISVQLNIAACPPSPNAGDAPFNLPELLSLRAAEARN